MEPKNPMPDPKNKEVFDLVKLAVQRLKSDAPFIIGITGAGGAGKTTFGNNLVQYYGSENCMSIDLDDYILSREERGKLEVSGYNPRANKLYLARSNISDLRLGKLILKPRYDHSTGKALEEERLEPKHLIVIEGVTTLYPELADLNDISFFLDALEETQIKSRIERDVNKRGYTLDEALALYENLKPEYKRFIEPTKKFASVICEVGPDYVMHPIHANNKLT